MCDSTDSYPLPLTQPPFVLSVLALSALMLPACLLGCGSGAASSESSGGADAGSGRLPGGAIRVSKETTYLTGPLRPDGGVDYLKAINELASEGVTVENNAAVPLARAFGPGILSDKATRTRFFRKLGIPVPAEEGRYFLDMAEFARQVAGREDGAYAEELLEQQANGAEKPWSRADLPKLAAWLDYNREPLKAVLEATRRRAYYAPLIVASGRDSERLLLATLLPLPQEVRSIARALTARAMLAAGEGRIDDAQRDLLACHRLARLIAKGPTLIEGLVGVALESIACEAGVGILRSGRPSDAELREYQRALAQLPPVWSAADAVNTAERLIVLDAVAYVADPRNDALEALTKLGGAGVRLGGLEKLAGDLDWNEVLRRLNEEYDRAYAAMSKDRYSERRAAIEEFEGHLEQVRAGLRKELDQLATEKPSPERATRLIADHLVSLMMAAMLQTQQSEDRGVTRLKLLRVAAGLERFRRANGRFPRTLGELKLGEQRDVLVDLYTEKPFLYRRTDSGYLLYSAGPNRRDDGAQTYDSDPPGDDIVVRMSREQ